MAVFQPQNVNLAPFYENIQRSIEKGGEAEASRAGAKYKVMQAGTDAIGKVANYYLMKQLEKRIEDQDKMAIPEETRKNFITGDLKIQEGTPEYDRMMELSGKYRGDVPTVLEMIKNTGQAVKEGTAIDDYLKSKSFLGLPDKEKEEIKLQLGFTKGREALFERFGEEAKIKTTAKAKGTTEEGALSQDKLKAKIMQEWVAGELEEPTEENKKKLVVIQEEISNPDIKTAAALVSKSFMTGALEPKQVFEATKNIAEALRQERTFVAPEQVEVQTSDGTIFTILETNLDTAKKRDKNLKVIRYGTPKPTAKK